MSDDVWDAGHGLEYDPEPKGWTNSVAFGPGVVVGGAFAMAKANPAILLLGSLLWFVVVMAVSCLVSPVTVMAAVPSRA